MAQQENTGCGWKTWAIIIIAIVACFRYCSLPSCGDSSNSREYNGRSNSSIGDDAKTKRLAQKNLELLAELKKAQDSFQLASDNYQLLVNTNSALAPDAHKDVCELGAKVLECMRKLAANEREMGNISYAVDTEQRANVFEQALKEFRYQTPSGY